MIEDKVVKLFQNSLGIYEAICTDKRARGHLKKDKFCCYPKNETIWHVRDRENGILMAIILKDVYWANQVLTSTS